MTTNGCMGIKDYFLYFTNCPQRIFYGELFSIYGFSLHENTAKVPFTGLNPRIGFIVYHFGDHTHIGIYVSTKVSRNHLA